MSAKGYNLTGNGITAGVAVAMYDFGGNLISVNIQHCEIPAYSCADIDVSNQSVPGNCAKIKWFLWDFDNIKPFKIREELLC